jgi:hypothetical protein
MTPTLPQIQVTHVVILAKLEATTPSPHVVILAKPEATTPSPHVVILAKPEATTIPPRRHSGEARISVLVFGLRRAAGLPMS